MSTVDVVITTINDYDEHSDAFLSWYAVAKAMGGRLIVVGDLRTPWQKYADLQCSDFKYLTVSECDSRWGALSSLVGTGTYCRKEFGYLVSTADYVFETDDDNICTDVKAACDAMRAAMHHGLAIECTMAQPGFVNVYDYFDGDGSWPRGYPMEYRESVSPGNGWSTGKINAVMRDQHVTCWVPGGEPDYCAVYRMYVAKHRAERKLARAEGRDVRDPVLLQPNMSFCCFNSQATLWPKSLKRQMAFPLSCPSRAADLIRGYWVQRVYPLLYADGQRWVAQVRNEHSVLDDWIGERCAGEGAEMFAETGDEFASFGLVENLERRHRSLWVQALKKETT